MYHMSAVFVRCITCKTENYAEQSSSIEGLTMYLLQR